jgi:hypothetical protein
MECVTCGSDHPSVTAWNSHYRKFHKSEPRWEHCRAYSVDFKFQCPVPGCGWSFKRYASMLYHHDRFHPGVMWTEPVYSHLPGVRNDPMLPIAGAQPGDMISPDPDLSDGTSGQLDPPLFDPPLFAPALSNGDTINPNVLDPALSLEVPETPEAVLSPPDHSPW